MVSENSGVKIAAALIKAGAYLKAMAEYIWFITEMQGLTPLQKIKLKCKCDEGAVKIKSSKNTSHKKWAKSSAEKHFEDVSKHW